MKLTGPQNDTPLTDLLLASSVVTTLDGTLGVPGSGKLVRALLSLDLVDRSTW
ncbi:hypothetical protein [Mesorhizobium sp. YM1C-6-2]|uniref:hypothetical protein n=1 Tax=Mesorhizobium sp. YM1C-6-2 TaxID=1827501 RepID=UPI001600EE8A|nr:hypothetical protein [Mesorhizobium sp. YM1C-6-2]